MALLGKIEKIDDLRTIWKHEAHDFSTTTEQVEGVAEADIVKTDGKYIYYLLGNELSIFKADGANSTLISKTVLKNEKYVIFLKNM